MLAAIPARETPAGRDQARLCFSEQGEAGVAACRLALERGLRPERAAVVNGVLASKLAASSRWEEAASAFEAWRRIAPSDPEPLRRLADVLLHGLGRADEAAARLQEAARLAPDDAPTWGALGVALATARRYDEAGAAFDTATSLAPDYFELRPATRAVAEAARRHEGWPTSS
jgi:tetratricopeptide (TPR) repeat protein